MKIQVFILLLSFAASESFSQVSKSNNAFTNVYHHSNNISLTNFDGTRSTIYVNGNSATLLNSDGSQSTIDFRGNFSTLIAIDGTSSSIFLNGFSSRVVNSDGTQIIVNHTQSTSSCSTANERHTITHTFSKVNEKRYKNIIDILIHRNWMIQKKAVEVMDELNREEYQN